MLSFHHSSISFLHSWDCIIIHPLLSFIPSWEWLEWVSDQVIDWWLIDWSELIEWSSDWVDSTELCSLWVWTQLSDSYARHECGLNWVMLLVSGLLKWWVILDRLIWWGGWYWIIFLFFLFCVLNSGIRNMNILKIRIIILMVGTM